MSLPDLDDPLNLDVAAQARNQPDAFAITAKYWTWVYANPHKPVLKNWGYIIPFD